ncbi:rho GTPase activator [Kwoniella heveanensis CBS 569]|nr:rho GTPase activator [Kwoniella heveanensis CBS 569]
MVPPPPPGSWPSSSASTSGRSIDGGPQESLPRRSIDHQRQHPSEASSSSRRTSVASIHNSPTSISSSSRHHIHRYGEDPQGQGSSAAMGHDQRSKLPRITTSNPDGVEAEGSGSGQGPRSAPITGPLRAPSNGMTVNGGTGPLRSSSSPDPWTTTHSQRSSPSNSPIDHRPNFTSPNPNSAGNGNGQAPSLGAPFLQAQHSGQSDQQAYSRRTSPGRPEPLRLGSDQNRDRERERQRERDRERDRSRDRERTITPQQSSQSLQHPGSRSRSGSDTQGNANAGAGASAQPSLVWPQPRTRREGGTTYCGQCGQVVHGQFVRAMGKVYHLNCFRCKDCNKVVAQKFFPVEDGDGMYPLCERDYFARLDLICAKCDQALRASYITACGNKYHVEHFTCSECDVLFGPNDSYYEHSGKVYCHYHYSTQFAVKCVGCETAILKQFVEMNRNGKDECWHPECYMISKFWNVRLASKTFNTPASSAVSSTISLLEIPNSEYGMTPGELKDRQEAMEMKVQQIWHVLSGYEESSAALIGDMLRAVNERRLLDIILLAERFILHVETLFAVIDDLDAQFIRAGAKGMAHAREAKQLCRKLVNLFSTMSQISPQGGPVPNNTELFTLITQLAHYLKILIRIALTGSIKLERDHNNTTAMTNCLARLNLLAMDNGDPTVKKQQLKRSIEALTRHPQGYIGSTQNIAYGYRSLAPEVTGETTLRGPQDENFIPPEGCAHCRSAIEEDCVRMGMFNRWHSACVICLICGETSLQPIKEDKDTTDEGSSHSHTDSSVAVVPSAKSQRDIKRLPARVDFFYFEPVKRLEEVPESIYCAHHSTSTCVQGFAAVSRLEQYAFLLHIALRRLYVHFRIHHDLESVRDHGISDRSEHEVKRMKSVTLDRKLSSTARLPQRSMVVESPAGRMADANGQVVSARSAEPDTPSTAMPDLQIDVDPDDPPPSATVDVLRPPFARNNTSVLIINENAEDLNNPNNMVMPTITPEDDAITLGDIPMLADPSSRPRHADERPLLSSLNPLQSVILKHFALLQLQKTGLGHLIELDEVLELLEVRKNQWWNKIFKGTAKKDQKKKGVFGVPIEILVERTGSDSSQGASNAQLRVPEIIEDIISTMRQMDMAVEGIFRKNGNIRKLQVLCEALDKDSTAINLSDENAIQLAALLKKFLREMPDPLLTFRLHKLFCAAASLQNPEDRRRVLHLLVVLLPRYNRDTMEVLFVFLRWVASFSYKDEETGSRMDLPNLATVICPSILYAKGANAARDESFIAIQAVQELMENQDEFYYVPNELVFVIHENIYSIFAKELDLPPKEIHRHCSKYMQARANAIQPLGFGTGMGLGGLTGGVAGQRTPGASGGTGGQGVPSSTSTNHIAIQSSQNQGQIRDRPSDPRLSVHRDILSSSSSDPTVLSSYRPAPAPPGSSSGPGAATLHNSRPTSWIQQQSSSARGSQASLTLNSPQAGVVIPGGGGGGPWRGPFQGSANGSRQSSRGSAPSSPGPEDRERRSIGMDRERSWTPTHGNGSEGHGGGHGLPHGHGGGHGYGASQHPFAQQSHR